jgi:hypothetical protein
MDKLSMIEVNMAEYEGKLKDGVSWNKKGIDMITTKICNFFGVMEKENRRG